MRISIGEDVREKRTAARRARAEEMSEALRMFTEGFEGELFNRPGTPWPEADVTIVDLGTLAREGYEAQMAVAVISLLNTINNIAEREQYSDRETIVPIDEAHIVTANPLLGPYATKIVKMWRKLGAWLWLFTQNPADFPDTAKKMLNMAEWWICLVMPPDEVEQIARFKTLTNEQKTMLLSATKLPRKYTEGVILSRKVQSLFRAVPPSLYLALGMTEKEEKAERREIMNQMHCSELEAASIGQSDSVALNKNIRGTVLPKFSRWIDYFNGLGMSVHDVYATNIQILSLDIYGHEFTATIKYSGQDHFGLDKSDIMNNKFHFLRAFRIWFVLQRWKEFGFKPFFTNINAVVTVNGRK